MALLLSPLHAQLKTYLTIEAGPHWSMIKVSDPGNYFKTALPNSTIAGFTVEQEFIKNLSLAAGLYYQPYKTGIRMDDQRRVQSRQESHTALMIPVRLQYRIQPGEFPVSFSPKLGYVYSMNSTPGGFVDTDVLSAPDGTAFLYDFTQSTEEPGEHLLELGIGVGLRFAGNWQASINLSYLSGTLSSSAASATVDYDDLQGNAYSAEYSSKGNGMYSTLSFHVPVSDIWQNRDYRIRSRIEDSAYDGKSVERKGQFYVGGEVGALWRLFYTSYPALGARPMEGRGLFKYANLHTGIYIGYMLTQELGLDVGINYQRSNTFYTLMYDHEVDFTGKTAAPMYLEVPVRFRYFYDLYKEKIYAVVYGGASLLTQFSSGGYESPAGDFSYMDPATQTQVIATTSSSTERLSSFRPIVRLGAGMEYLLPMKFPLFVTAYINYMQGFMAVEQVLVSTSIPGSSGSVVYQGSGWSLDVGFKIPIAFDDRQNCVRLTRDKGEKEKKVKGTKRNRRN